MRITGYRPEPPIATAPGADETLQPITFALSSGNVCTVTPSMKCAGDEMRCGVQFAWGRPPSREEQDCLIRELEEMGMSKFEFLAQCGSKPEADAIQSEWLKARQSS